MTTSYQYNTLLPSATRDVMPIYYRLIPGYYYCSWRIGLLTVDAVWAEQKLLHSIPEFNENDFTYILLQGRSLEIYYEKHAEKWNPRTIKSLLMRNTSVAHVCSCGLGAWIIMGVLLLSFPVACPSVLYYTLYPSPENLEGSHNLFYWE